VAFVSSLALPAAAHAQEERGPDAGEPAAPDAAPPASDPPDAGTDAPAPIDEKRPIPDYEGKGEKEPSDDALLWVPRILVLPIYLTTEYLIRRPIGAIVSGMERSRVVQRAIYFITFGGNKNIGLVPTAFADFGVLPSVGLYFFWDDALVTHNHVRVHAGTWGPQWLSLSVTDRYDAADLGTVALRASWTRRSDHPFFGLGPTSSQSNESRYAATTLDVGPSYELRVSRLVSFESAVGLRSTTFGEDTCCGDPSVQDRVRAGQLALPPRLLTGYTMGYERATLALDTRPSRPAPQTGVRISAFGQPAFDVSRRPGNSWLNYGATVGGFWDVTGKARVLSLSFTTLFSDPLTGSGSDIPFNEQIQLGGDGFMRGFLAGRMIDRSAVVATIGYQWPVWTFLDGTLQASTGNVFGAGLRGVEAGKLRLSSGVGLRTNGSPDHQFELLVGFGTDTFDEGATIRSFRLALGGTHGF
jgi:Omp85 superfamily domain